MFKMKSSNVNTVANRREVQFKGTPSANNKLSQRDFVHVESEMSTLNDRLRELCHDSGYIEEVEKGINAYKIELVFTNDVNQSILQNVISKEFPIIRVSSTDNRMTINLPFHTIGECRAAQTGKPVGYMSTADKIKFGAVVLTKLLIIYIGYRICWFLLSFVKPERYM